CGHVGRVASVTWVTAYRSCGNGESVTWVTGRQPNCGSVRRRNAGEHGGVAGEAAAHAVDGARTLQEPQGGVDLLAAGADEGRELPLGDAEIDGGLAVTCVGCR